MNHTKQETKGLFAWPALLAFCNPRQVLVLTMCGLLFLPAAAANGLGSESEQPWLASLVVPAGETLQAEGPLRSLGDIRIDGRLEAAPGQPLVVESAGDILVHGALVAPAGAPGEAGSDVRLIAAGRIELRALSEIQAGAGGHGQARAVPGGLAQGQAGGKGGSILLDAPSVIYEGQLLPGRGGNGGTAYGLQAVGGDGGDMGSVLVQGKPVPSDGWTQNPTPPSGMLQSCSLVDIGIDATTPGADGGSACAEGLDGGQGDKGADGRDHGMWDDCEWGGRGGMGKPGIGPATAKGGRGGDVTTGSGNAGNGGEAKATGGTGGRGGEGGMGGNGGTIERGCRGGEGGQGGRGGDATATAGAQGLNLLDCTKDGKPGKAALAGAQGGDGGPGGAGGGANWPRDGGESGPAGPKGPDGTKTEVPVITRLCVSPKTATVLAAPVILTKQINVHITAPADTGGLPILGYKVYRSEAQDDPQAFLAEKLATGVPEEVYSDKDVECAQTYWYTVIVHTSGGDSDPSSPPSGATVTCAKGVGDGPILGALPGGSRGKVSLTITEPVTQPDNTEIYYYKIYVGQGIDQELRLATPTAPYNGGVSKYDFPGLSPGGVYRFEVAAVYDSGQVSPHSNTATSVAALSIKPTAGATPHSATGPTGGASGIELTIALPMVDLPDEVDNPGELTPAVDQYEIWRGQDPLDASASGLSLIATISHQADIDTYLDTDVVPGSVYLYTVVPLLEGDLAGDHSDTVVAVAPI